MLECARRAVAASYSSSSFDGSDGCLDQSGTPHSIRVVGILTGTIWAAFLVSQNSHDEGLLGIGSVDGNKVLVPRHFVLSSPQFREWKIQLLRNPTRKLSWEVDGRSSAKS